MDSDTARPAAGERPTDDTRRTDGTTNDPSDFGTR